MVLDLAVQPVYVRIHREYDSGGKAQEDEDNELPREALLVIGFDFVSFRSRRLPIFCLGLLPCIVNEELSAGLLWIPDTLTLRFKPLFDQHSDLHIKVLLDGQEAGSLASFVQKVGSSAIELEDLLPHRDRNAFNADCGAQQPTNNASVGIAVTTLLYSQPQCLLI